MTFKMHRTEFVRIWQTASGLTDVCAQTGYAPLRATQIASSLRKRGIPLRKWPRGPRKKTSIEIEAKAVRDELAALARSLGPVEPFKRTARKAPRRHRVRGKPKPRLMIEPKAVDIVLARAPVAASPE